MSFCRIISGAPYGIYPGGLDMPARWQACQQFQSNAQLCTAHNAVLMNYTSDQILECYNTSRTGLIYSCPLNLGDCAGFVGNGDTNSNDGLLFDSRGM